ncbi:MULTISPECIES: hypothetical protein [Haloferax]|uniref:hypothetical protein n=1 Tax=Haloferax TaxID=2251 RepID=UPI00177BCBED|nr:MULTISPECIES: hypothetical protein [Haloferax]
MQISPPDWSRTTPTRRRFLQGSGLVLASLAGCTGSEVKDTDGDGVVDSKDYAPRDPDVRFKSDVQGTAAVTKQSPTPTATATPQATPTQTPTPTPTPAPSSGTSMLTAKNPESLERTSYISSYGTAEVTVNVSPDEFTETEISGTDLVVFLGGYPREREYARGRTAIEPDESRSYTISIDFPNDATGRPLHYLALLVSSDTDLEDASNDDLSFFHETDPFVVDEETFEPERTTVPELESMGSESGENYSRFDTEGMWDITVTGRTNGTNWEAYFYVYKAAYVIHRRKDHGRNWADFVNYEMQNGYLESWATLLYDVANDIGFTEKRVQAEFVIDFVQGLPYVPDDVSSGFDDYTKFTVETLGELGGDCEDTAILLAGVLQAEPFGYDTVLIHLPEHMGVGIKGRDLRGTYWELDGNQYYYIETTGENWGVGDLPDEYRDDSAYVYQV